MRTLLRLQVLVCTHSLPFAACNRGGALRLLLGYLNFHSGGSLVLRIPLVHVKKIVNHGGNLELATFAIRLTHDERVIHVTHVGAHRDTVALEILLHQRIVAAHRLGVEAGFLKETPAIARLNVLPRVVLGFYLARCSLLTL